MMGCCCSKSDTNSCQNFNTEMTQIKPKITTGIKSIKNIHQLPNVCDSPLSVPEVNDNEILFFTPRLKKSTSLPNKRQNVFINTMEINNADHDACTMDNITNTSFTILVNSDKVNDLYFNYEKIRSYSM